MKNLLHKETRTSIQNIKTNPMLIRLPITLAQLQARSNSQKLKNEIRQLIYLLYSSKKLTKTIYNHLINAIQKWKRYLLTLKIARLMNLKSLGWY